MTGFYKFVNELATTVANYVDAADARMIRRIMQACRSECGRDVRWRAPVAAAAARTTGGSGKNLISKSAGQHIVIETAGGVHH